MPGLVPGIHDRDERPTVDGRDKPGHDGEPGFQDLDLRPAHGRSTILSRELFHTSA